MYVLPGFSATAQDSTTDSHATTGGAQNLADILARQQGQKLDDTYRKEATGLGNTAADIAAQLGSLGGTSDAEVFRALRYGTADVTVSTNGPSGTCDHSRRRYALAGISQRPAEKRRRLFVTGCFGIPGSVLFTAR